MNVISRRRRAPPTGDPSVFRAAEGQGEGEGVWTVTRDAVFYGEYLTRTDALVSACSAAREVEALGGAAEVRVGPREILVRHQDRYPGRVARS